MRSFIIAVFAFLLLIFGGNPMSKGSSEIVSVVGKLLPSEATHYRLVDSLNRVFPPQDQPAFHARARVDLPNVPAGEYGIRFEDSQNRQLSYTDDGSLKQVRLGDGPVVTASPDEIEIRRERGYQRVEKREHALREHALKNEGIAELLRLLIESQANAAKRDKQSIKMVKIFTKGQKQLLKQQNALFEQSAKMNAPPPVQNWPGAATAIVASLGKVISTAVETYGDDRKPRGDRVLDAVPRGPALVSSGQDSPPEQQKIEDAPAAQPAPAPEQLAQKSSTPANRDPVPPTEDRDPPQGEAGPKPSPAGNAAASPGPASTAQPQIAKRDLDPALPKSQTPRRSLAQIAWREMKRRVVSLSDSQITELLSSRERLVDWLRWLAQPADLLALAST